MLLVAGSILKINQFTGQIIIAQLCTIILPYLISGFHLAWHHPAESLGLFGDRC